MANLLEMIASNQHVIDSEFKPEDVLNNIVNRLCVSEIKHMEEKEVRKFPALTRKEIDLCLDKRKTITKQRGIYTWVYYPSRSFIMCGMNIRGNRFMNALNVYNSSNRNKHEDAYKESIRQLDWKK